MANITNRLISSTRSVADLLPIQDFPPPQAVRGIYNSARAQIREIREKFRSSNEKAVFTKEHLTPEQMYIYEWIAYIFVIFALPHETFARQIGCSVTTLKAWLKRNGHFPQKRYFTRLLDIYKMNFCDETAREVLHGARIGQWRELRRHKTKAELMQDLNNKLGEIND